MDFYLELIMAGLIRGAIYSLIALGYTMVYGIIELINFAHGEIYMIGAFTGLIVASVLGFSGFPTLGILVIAGVVATIYCAGYGVTLEKIAYKPLRKAPRLSPLISAIGMSIFLQNYVLLAQTSDFMPFPSLIPDFEFLEPISHILASTDLVILVVAATVMTGLTLFIRLTRLGKAMRATAQNQKMAMLVGIDIDKVVSVTFLIGSALAAIGGVLIGSFSGQINFVIGFMAGIKAFTAAVLGGIGSIPGAMLGGLVLGVAENLPILLSSLFLEIGLNIDIPNDYRDAVAFILLIVILILRPSGILGRAKIQKV